MYYYAELLGVILGLAVKIGLAFIPAKIIKDKGHDNYGAWWIFGFFLWLIAIICAACATDYSKGNNNNTNNNNYSKQANENNKSSINDLKDLKELYDEKAITKEEYERIKSKLLKDIVEE